MGKASTRAKNKYNRKAYDRINIMVPRGDRAVIQAVARMNGMSVNEYICRLVYRSFGAKFPFQRVSFIKYINFKNLLVSPAVRAGGRTAGGGLSCRQDREAPTHLNYTKENFCIIRKPTTAAVKSSVSEVKSEGLKSRGHQLRRRNPCGAEPCGAQHLVREENKAAVAIALSF